MFNEMTINLAATIFFFIIFVIIIVLLFNACTSPPSEERARFSNGDEIKNYESLQRTIGWSNVRPDMMYQMQPVYTPRYYYPINDYDAIRTIDYNPAVFATNAADNGHANGARSATAPPPPYVNW